MKLIRFMDPQSNVHYGRLCANGDAEVVTGCIASGFLSTGERLAVSKILIPIIPTNIFAVGFNYLQHANEIQKERPLYPVLFMKPTSCLTPSDSTVLLPACEQRGPETDFEGELAIVIGSSVKNASVNNALQYVFGYTCANDISARRWQKHAGEGQWVRGKGFDTFCPLGPVIVTADEIPDPQNLRIQTFLNGKTMQNAHTSEMLFTVAEIIHYISQDTTLLPGTVILTGTPDGVGVARNPRVFLRPGDDLSVVIDGIGSLQNRIDSAISQ